MNEFSSIWTLAFYCTLIGAISSWIRMCSESVPWSWRNFAGYIGTGISAAMMGVGFVTIWHREIPVLIATSILCGRYGEQIFIYILEAVNHWLNVLTGHIESKKDSEEEEEE